MIDSKNIVNLISITKFILNLQEWQKVRALGSLQILTRASYGMLIFVPLLASLWPAVRAFFNRYNQAVNESRVALETASERLELTALEAVKNEPTLLMIEEIVKDLRHRIDLVLQEYATSTIDDVTLPSVWVVAFFASLAVAAGHVIYQAFAPRAVQEFSEIDYTDKRVREFRNAQTDLKLDNAIRTIDKHGNDFEKHLLTEYFTKDVDLQSSKIESSSEEGEIDKEKFKEMHDRVNSANILSVIEIAAKIKYRRMASDKPSAAMISSIFYFIALVGVAYIIANQSVNVLEAAGGVDKLLTSLATSAE